MSTANFYSQNNFRLFIQSFEPISMEEYEKEYFIDSFYYDEWLDSTDEEYKKYLLEKSYEKDMNFECEMFYEDIFNGYDGFKDVMEDFSDTLMFHELEITSGYYDGVQIYVAEKENPYELDNEDCHYYFDMCRSKAIRKYDTEINKINRWFEKVASQHGWRELYVVARFSNGETWYNYAS